MATISNTPRPGYVWDSTDNVWYPIGVGAHQHTNAADTPAVMPYSTYAAAGKNKFLNADMSLNQYALTSITNPNTAIIDRFRGRATAADGTSVFSYETFTSGEAPLSQYERKNYLKVVTSGQTTDAARTNFEQFIENVQSFAGQTVTFSFWAKAASGTPNIAIEMGQSFGVGGSVPVNILAGTRTLSTSWQRFTVTTNIPSVTGATIGANSFLWVGIIVSAGSAFTRGQGIGIQSNSFSTWGWQIEAGSNATAFETATGNPASELAACQRYYFRTTGGPGYQPVCNGFATSSTNVMGYVQYPVTMRTSPTSIEYATLQCNDSTVGNVVSAVAFSGTEYGPSSATLNFTTSGMTTFRPVKVLQSNSASGYLALSAEL